MKWPTPDPRDNDVPQRSLIAYNSQSTSAILAGFESPKTPGRSVVLVASNEGLV
ncbi:cellulose biosynthesis cyclic di-GMP-binding regulatory protein BcsB [Neopusillimonas aromaticivorans]|uniref:cellulose biosynthesis cyclic di-GMP-binding regulatory protein BcsB n=1 Tax=Neopusillimonas aromaticivorans TaxID=2979868 RepID=UPI00259A3961|nr:cellulose biosynthesis cyclic di-GMP-binding regulatory protein BcsB [Neopusillimonas aromaticivorans]WJJ94983.1 cellulose biosynthesis cyclic di-GMP-binding regulatory protein BcsB [Neopusillimonas aromaticivorans]